MKNASSLSNLDYVFFSIYLIGTAMGHTASTQNLIISVINEDMTK